MVKKCIFIQKWLDHMVFMTYIVTTAKKKKKKKKERERERKKKLMGKIETAGNLGRNHGSRRLKL